MVPHIIFYLLFFIFIFFLAGLGILNEGSSENKRKSSGVTNRDNFTQFD